MQAEASGLVRHDATSSACGAACFIRVRSHCSCVVVCFSHEVTVSNSALSQGTLSRLPDQCPGDIDFAGHEIEVVQITQQAKSSRARPTEEVVV